MTNLKKNVPLSSSVTVAFFGVLLIISLLLNVGILLKLENIPQQQPLDHVFSEYSSSSQVLKKRYENGKVWIELPDPIFDAYFLTDPSCKSCVDISQMKKDFELMYPTARIKDVNISSSTGKELLNAGTSVIPAIILSKAFKNTQAFEEVTKVGVVSPIGEKYFEYRTMGSKKILDENRLPKEMQEKGGLKVVGYTDFFSQESANFSAIVPQIAAEIDEEIVVKNNSFVTDIPSAFLAEAVHCGVDMQKIIDSREEYFEAIQGVSKDDGIHQISGVLKDILAMEGEIAECYEKGEFFNEMQRISKEASELGITGKPAFFVGKYFLAGPQTAEIFSSTIRDALQETSEEVEKEE
jgi:hypothetical protein